MPAGELFNSFDDDEFDSGPEVQQQQVAAPAPGIVISVDDDEPQPEYEEIDEEMSEGQRRISLAGYYMQLAKGGVFKDGTEEAALVDAELKQFARERMDLLLNLGNYKPKVEMPFTDGQIEVLKALADRYSQKQLAPQQPQQPQVRPLAPPTAPAAPQATRPTVPQVKPLTPPANAGKPSQAAQKPRAKKPTAAPVAKPRPPKVDRVDIEQYPLGEVFEENGKQYKVVEHPDTGKRMKVHVTAGQVRNPRQVPMPSIHEMDHVTARDAERNLNSNPALKHQSIVTAAAMSAAGVNEIGGK
jgi:hypothetical protein